MSGEALLRIGAFSRASWLSIKALRAYHEAGLLVPAEVDPRTGYRSYTTAQLADAAIIRKLRQLDVPLEGIREVLEARDAAVTRKVLTEHGALLEERIVGTQRAVDELYAALDAPALQAAVHRRHEPARMVLSFPGTVTESEWMPFLERARTLLDDAANDAGAVVDGPFGACYPPLLDDDAQDVLAFVTVNSAPLLSAAMRKAGVAVGELPATDVAVLEHRGDYDDLEDAYRELGSWVATHGQPTDLPVRELYLVGPIDTDDPSNYRTEICWPVQPPSSTEQET
ncbi:MAG TPA: MerR family transcriptional regulator [Acidimicrobiia bacterium]|jgi:DNA-binding transcriptional MerR regulator